MTSELQHLSLPEDIQNKLQAYQNHPVSQEFRDLIGSSGYEAEDKAIVFDAVIALTMGKNILLKGMSGFRENKIGGNAFELFS